LMICISRICCSPLCALYAMATGHLKTAGYLQSRVFILELAGKKFNRNHVKSR